MDFVQAKKKKLDFDGNSFIEPEFKVPVITSDIESRLTSASCFGDDEESSEESTSSATSMKSQETVNVSVVV